MEKNEAFVDNPPLDYLEALVGIIDSFRMLHNKTEVSYYLNKLKNLDQKAYPEYFRYLVRKTFSIQQMVVLLDEGKLEEARQFLTTISADVFDNYSMVDEEKQIELYFYSSLVYFRLADFRKAHLYIREIMNKLKLPEQLLVSKAIRLLNILIYYEKGELVHLEYEIRSYKRYFLQSRLLKIEKTIFKIIACSAANKRLRIMPSSQRKMLLGLDGIDIDRYEQQLHKYFNFAAWAREIVIGKNRKAEILP